MKTTMTSSVTCDVCDAKLTIEHSLGYDPQLVGPPYILPVVMGHAAEEAAKWLGWTFDIAKATSLCPEHSPRMVVVIPRERFA